MMPSRWPRSSSSRSLRIPSARSVRALRVSKPWMFLASAQRCRPSLVLGPVDLPPCMRHIDLPHTAGPLQRMLDLFDLAWHWLHLMRPPRVVKVDMSFLIRQLSALSAGLLEGPNFLLRAGPHARWVFWGLSDDAHVRPFTRFAYDRYQIGPLKSFEAVVAGIPRHIQRIQGSFGYFYPTSF